jgi:molybdopterin/thiamine biosynthesis adenylyltransferase
MLEDYSCDEQEIRKSWENIKSSRVCIIGLGAVGSWIAANLVQSGVTKLILIDKDVVDVTNLHRQWGYRNEDIGKDKADALEMRLKEMNHLISVTKYKTFIDEGILDSLNMGDADLVIDCADKPTVDQTAVWVGEYCMGKNIPHIIAGGYNLHVSLIGQTIIPFKTACVKCFEKQLKEHNELELSKMKKLATPGRKIGSIGPMCSLSASFAATEAVKVLSRLIPPSNINRRGEFNIYNMDINYHNYPKIVDCEWCGENGKYIR